jgi:serine/threonine-protein kinase
VLEYLHGHEPPIIYRDLKPSNIMIDVKGRVKLVDFGIARHHDENADYTHVVSAGYSPPEQYRGSGDERSDIYSLGATMHYLLTGHEPIALHVCCPIDVSDDVSFRTSAIIEKATAQDPDERYSNAREMHAELLPEEETQKLPVARNKRMELMIAGFVILASGLALLAYFKLNEVLMSKQEQIQAKDQMITKWKQEREQLSQKLKVYSRAVEAQQKAIVEWHDISKQTPSSDASSTGDIAAQSAAELQMTDPEGLVDPEGSQPSTQSAAPAFPGLFH